MNDCCPFTVVKMADAAAARREARRKRILENSHTRLQIISGKDVAVSPKASCTSAPTLSDNAAVEDCTDHSNNVTRRSYLNGSLASEPILSTLPVPTEDLHQEIFRSINVSNIENKPRPTLYEKLVMFKYDIVLLSITLQLFYRFILASDNSYFFLPLLIYDVTKLLWLSNDEESNLASTLLLMNGVSPGKVQSIMKFVQFFMMMSKDLCVYLFTTACSHIFIMIMSDNVTT